MAMAVRSLTETEEEVAEAVEISGPLLIGKLEVTIKMVGNNKSTFPFTLYCAHSNRGMESLLQILRNLKKLVIILLNLSPTLPRSI